MLGVDQGWQATETTERPTGLMSSSSDFRENCALHSLLPPKLMILGRALEKQLFHMRFRELISYIIAIVSSAIPILRIAKQKPVDAIRE